MKWEKGQRIILSKWDKYYGNKLGIEPPLSEMIFEVIKHPNTQLQALQSKDIDKMGFTQEQWVNKTDGKEFKGKNAFINKFKYTSKSYSYIGWNQKKDLFKDKKVRQALTHLVNREKILKDVYYNLGRIVTGNFFIDSVYNDKSIKPYEFNIEKAKQLLKNAGWEDTNGDMILDKNSKNFEFTILAVSNHPIHQKMLPIIKEDMAKVGIIMDVQKLEWPVYVQRLNEKKFDACTLGWGMGFESDPHQIWHSSHADKDSSSNHISFKNKKADELIDKIRVEFDLEKRTKLCHQFHQLLHEEQPYTFLFSSYSLVGVNKNLKNAKVFPVGLPSKIMYKE